MTNRGSQKNMQILSTIIGIKELRFMVPAICDIYKTNWNAFCKLENRWTCDNLLSRPEKEES